MTVLDHLKRCPQAGNGAVTRGRMRACAVWRCAAAVAAAAVRQRTGRVNPTRPHRLQAARMSKHSPGLRPARADSHRKLKLALTALYAWGAARLSVAELPRLRPQAASKNRTHWRLNENRNSNPPCTFSRRMMSAVSQAVALRPALRVRVGLACAPPQAKWLQRRRPALTPVAHPRHPVTSATAIQLEAVAQRR